MGFILNVLAIFPVVLFNLSVSLMHVTLSALELPQMPPFPLLKAECSVRQLADAILPPLKLNVSLPTCLALFHSSGLCCAHF